MNLQVLLFPMATTKAENGGLLIDEDGELEPTDVKNLAHVVANIEAYKEIAPVKRALELGEVAAIIRLARDSGVSLKELSEQLAPAQNEV